MDLLQCTIIKVIKILNSKNSTLSDHYMPRLDGIFGPLNYSKDDISYLPVMIIIECNLSYYHLYAGDLMGYPTLIHAVRNMCIIDDSSIPHRWKILLKKPISKWMVT